MSDNLNSDKHGHADTPGTPENAYKPTLSDQHWRVFLREKTSEELEDDLNAAIAEGNDWRFNLVMQLDIDLRNPTTLMETAIENNRTDMLVALAEKSGDWRDSYTKNRLAGKAAEAGRTDVLKVLVEKYDADLHHYDDELLRTAASHGHLETVQYLLSKGAEVDSWNNRPLRDACEGGHLPVVKCLVEAGADVNAENGTPLSEAARGNHLAVVKYLISKGADIALGDYAALSAAASDDAADVLKLLLQKAQGEAAQSRKNDALLDAVMHEQLAAAKQLVDAGADINTDHGRALRSASWRGELKAVTFLLQNGANPNVHANRETPLSEAVNAGHMDVVEALVAAGADPAYLQNEALSAARRREREDMVEAMQEGAIVARENHRRKKAEEFGETFTGDYSLDDLRSKKGSSGESGLMLAAQTGYFDDIIRAAKGGKAPYLTTEDLYHPDDRVDTVLTLLLREDKLQQFFTPDFWADRKNALVDTYLQLPEALQKKIDLGPVASEINYRELLRKANGKNGRPPRL